MQQLSRPEAGDPRLVGATVVVASSRTARRRRLAAALRRDGLQVVALKSNAERALAAVQRRRPRLCVLDADLDGNLMIATRELCREHREMVLAVVVDAGTERRGLRALRAGADLVIRDGGRRLVDQLTAFVSQRAALEPAGAPLLAVAPEPEDTPQPEGSADAEASANAAEPAKAAKPGESPTAPPPLMFAAPAPRRRPVVRGIVVPRRRVRRLDAPPG
jgi:DNA-binding NarL/FixJ family response regulator